MSKEIKVEQFAYYQFVAQDETEPPNDFSISFLMNFVIIFLWIVLIYL